MDGIAELLRFSKLTGELIFSHEELCSKEVFIKSLEELFNEYDSFIKDKTALYSLNGCISTRFVFKYTFVNEVIRINFIPLSQK